MFKPELVGETEEVDANVPMCIFITRNSILDDGRIFLKSLKKYFTIKLRWNHECRIFV